MILVIGGTGVVGAQVVDLLMSQKQQVRVLAGGYSDWHQQLTPQMRKAGVDVVNGDIRDQRVLAKAVSGCTGIVHTAGVISDQPERSVDSVNHESVASLLPIAENAGVQRFVYVSCLGATQFSSSEYLRSKWNAEMLVRQSNFLWTVFRPSLIFGEGSQLMRVLEFWVQRFPIVLCTGSGLNHLEPISVDDVAECVVQSLYNRDTVNQVYDLVGPETMNLSQLLELVTVGFTGQHKAQFKLPARAGYLLADLLAKLNPRSPLS